MELAGGASLQPDAPVTLRWENGKGLIFTREISVDEKFMFTITDSVENTGAAPVSLQPYGMIRRHGLPKTCRTSSSSMKVLSVAPMATLTEVDYADVVDLAAGRARAAAMPMWSRPRPMAGSALPTTTG